MGSYATPIIDLQSVRLSEEFPVFYGGGPDVFEKSKGVTNGWRHREMNQSTRWCLNMAGCRFL